MHEVKAPQSYQSGIPQVILDENLDYAEEKEIQYMRSAIDQMKTEFA